MQPNRHQCQLLTQLSVLLFCLASANAGDPFPEGEYPNVVPPLSQFGDYGLGLGALNEPVGIAFDSHNKIYIAESQNARIQVFDPHGNSIFAWLGTERGELLRPQGIAIDSQDRVFVTDANDHVSVYNASGDYLFQFGTSGGELGQLNSPTSIAISGNRVYVVDEGNSRIHLFDDSGNPILVFGNHGFGNGQFLTPQSIAADEAGNSYVVDLAHRIQKFDSQGRFVASWGIYGGYSGQLAEPHGIFYHNNLLFVADTVNHRLQVFNTSGQFIVQWGRHPETHHGGIGRTHYPCSISVNHDGTLAAILEPNEYRCQVFQTATIKSLPQVDVTAWWEKYPQFHYGGGLRIARARKVEKLTTLATHENVANLDLLIITEPDIHKVVAMRCLPDGTLKQHYSIGEFGAGPLHFAMLAAKAPFSDGTMLVGDAGNNVVQKIDLLTGAHISTHFGPGSGPSQFRGPSAFVEGPNGLIYISDYHNDRVQVFDSEFQFKFLFGGTGSARGKLFGPMSMQLSADNKRLYIVDAGNHRIQVFDLDGQFITEFGRLTQPGESGQGTFQNPFDLAVAPDGTVYVTDPALQLVQKFDPDGKFITQWGGWGTQPGQFYKCKGIDVDSAGRVYVIDFGNHRGQVFDANGNFLAIFGEGILYPAREKSQ